MEQNSAAFTPLKSPFPWFGGKSRAASLIWERFGDVKNYVEPFAGSLAVLLSRPHSPKTETVNDIDCMVANFWRALAQSPVSVAKFADWPVNEADLHARHLWLVNQVEFRERMKTEPDYYDAKIAGWWVWGLCQWIGSDWCKQIKRQLPHLGNAGRGINRMGGRDERIDYYNYIHALHTRLRYVRVACGDWTRVLGDSVTCNHGLTGVLLDPPYGVVDRDTNLYTHESTTVSASVRKWAITAGIDPNMRIALCGYEGEHDMPKSWQCVEWKAQGGYGSQGDANANAHRERIWFSPYCLNPESSIGVNRIPARRRDRSPKI